MWADKVEKATVKKASYDERLMDPKGFGGVKSNGQEILNIANPGDGFFLEDGSNIKVPLTNLFFENGQLSAPTCQSGYLWERD